MDHSFAGLLLYFENQKKRETSFFYKTLYKSLKSKVFAQKYILKIHNFAKI